MLDIWLSNLSLLTLVNKIRLMMKMLFRELSRVLWGCLFLHATRPHRNLWFSDCSFWLSRRSCLFSASILSMCIFFLSLLIWADILFFRFWSSSRSSLSVFVVLLSSTTILSSRWLWLPEVCSSTKDVAAETTLLHLILARSLLKILFVLTKWLKHAFLCCSVRLLFLKRS